MVPAAATSERDAERESYAFVMNVLELTDGESYELASGHVLRRATPDEISVIKNTVQSIVGSHSAPFGFYLFWEYRWPYQGGTLELLPEGDWRYYVIAFRGTNVTLNRLQAAMDLAPMELEIGFTFLYDLDMPLLGPGMLWNAGRLFHVLEAAQWDNSFFKRVAGADLGAITAIHASLAAHDKQLIDVERLARRVGELKSFPHESPLRFLGYFAILESLLTHAPKPTDPYDSVTRQVKRKVALLDHRWPDRINYTPFGNASSDTVWSKMYAYRSLLAHGEAPSELTVLGSSEQALQLVKETVKSVIRHALAEPQLLFDLREC